MISELKNKLEVLYGDRLEDVILFEDYELMCDKNKAIEIAVVLSGDVQKGEEIDRMIEMITGFNLKYDTLTSVYPVSIEEYKNLNSPIIMNLRKNGVTI